MYMDDNVIRKHPNLLTRSDEIQFRNCVRSVQSVRGDELPFADHDHLDMLQDEGTVIEAEVSDLRRFAVFDGSPVSGSTLTLQGLESVDYGAELGDIAALLIDKVLPLVIIENEHIRSWMPCSFQANCNQANCKGRQCLGLCNPKQNPLSCNLKFSASFSNVMQCWIVKVDFAYEMRAIILQNLVDAILLYCRHPLQDMELLQGFCWSWKQFAIPRLRYGA